MLAYAYSLLERVKADRKGVTAMEYGVIAAGIVIAVAAAATTVGNDISALFTSIGGSL
jgi:pilus assembly protein Flp/PilA